MKRDSFVKDAFVLCIITLLSGLLLGGAYMLTKAPIEEANRRATYAAYEKVIPAASYDDSQTGELVMAANEEGSLAQEFAGAKILAAVIARDEGGKALGYVVTAAAKGYGGDVKLVCGVLPDGSLSGISFPEALPETPGLGQKAVEPEFYGQYAGKSGVLRVVKAAEAKGAADEIDAISGATITSKAVTAAVNAASAFAQRLAAAQ